MEAIGDLDTVWVLWPSRDLVVWSRERHEWINFPPAAPALGWIR
jgi:hypothetical protein